MKYILHDIKAEEAPWFAEVFVEAGFTLINANAPAAKCTGCFKCWLKHPGMCAFSDQLKWIGKELITSEQLIIVCKGLYGGFPVNVKRILDRVIPGILPFFRVADQELHHARRYRTATTMKVIFYNSDDMTSDEKEHARRLIAAVGINFHVKEHEVVFQNGLHGILQEVGV